MAGVVRAAYPGARAVVLGGRTDTGGAALVAAVAPESGLGAGELIKDAAAAVKGGGGGGKGDVAVFAEPRARTRPALAPTLP